MNKPKRLCPVCGDYFHRKDILSLYAQCICGTIFTKEMHYIPVAHEGYFTGFLTQEYLNGQIGFGNDLDRIYHDICTRKALEIGCGVGTVLGAMAKKGWKCTGIDNAPKGIEKARELYPEVEFQCMPFDEYLPPVEGAEWGQFGLIISNNTIEHFHSPRSVFIIAWKLLEAGGIFSVQTPSTGFWMDKRQPWVHACETTHKGEHTVLFDRETLICLATQCGFEVAKIHNNSGPECVWIDFKKRWL